MFFSPPFLPELYIAPAKPNRGAIFPDPRFVAFSNESLYSRHWASAELPWNRREFARSITPNGRWLPFPRRAADARPSGPQSGAHHIHYPTTRWLYSPPPLAFREGRWREAVDFKGAALIPGLPQTIECAIAQIREAFAEREEVGFQLADPCRVGRHPCRPHYGGKIRAEQAQAPRPPLGREVTNKRVQGRFLVKLNRQ